VFQAQREGVVGKRNGKAEGDGIDAHVDFSEEERERLCIF